MESLNIEVTLVNFLNSRAELANVPASGSVPDERPERFITVERVGGNRDNERFDRPMVAIQCWVDGITNRAAASDLALLVDSLLPELTNFENRVTRVERNSLYNFPEEDGKQARYQIVVDLTTI